MKPIFGFLAVKFTSNDKFLSFLTATLIDQKCSLKHMLASGLTKQRKIYRRYLYPVLFIVQFITFLTGECDIVGLYYSLESQIVRNSGISFSFQLNILLTFKLTNTQSRQAINSAYYPISEKKNTIFLIS